MGAQHNDFMASIYDLLYHKYIQSFISLYMHKIIYSINHHDSNFKYTKTVPPYYTDILVYSVEHNTVFCVKVLSIFLNERAVVEHYIISELKIKFLLLIIRTDCENNNI